MREYVCQGKLFIVGWLHWYSIKRGIRDIDSRRFLRRWL